METIHYQRQMTKGEFAVFLEVLRGKSNKTVAESLFVTEKAVKFHLTSIYKKLGVTTRHELMAKCLLNDPYPFRDELKQVLKENEVVTQLPTV